MLSVNDLVGGTRVICIDKTSERIGKTAVINSFRKHEINDYNIYITWDNDGLSGYWPWDRFDRYMTSDPITTKPCQHCGCYNALDSIFHCWYCKEIP